jgi:1,4-dihydroxy-2-naphthoyl-CoA hydrolase
LLGLEVIEVSSGVCRVRFHAARRLQAPHGYLHRGAVVGLADTACGYGCVTSLPEGASGFTTIELKTNFLGTVQEGPVVAEARLVHSGRRTQLWDAVVSDETTGRTISLVRCTQMVLYPG